MTLPARSATSRTVSTSSDNPRSTIGNAKRMRDEKAWPITEGRNTTNHSMPSRAAGLAVADCDSNIATTWESCGSPTAVSTSAARHNQVNGILHRAYQVRGYIPERPWAPPERSTVETSLCRLPISQAIKSGNTTCPSPAALG
jgi:hypothetical protein